MVALGGRTLGALLVALIAFGLCFLVLLKTRDWGIGEEEDGPPLWYGESITLAELKEGQRRVENLLLELSHRLEEQGEDINRAKAASSEALVELSEGAIEQLTAQLRGVDKGEPPATEGGKDKGNGPAKRAPVKGPLKEVPAPGAPETEVPEVASKIIEPATGNFDPSLKPFKNDDLYKNIMGEQKRLDMLTTAMRKKGAMVEKHKKLRGLTMLVVPYRDRASNWALFKQYMTAYLSTFRDWGFMVMLVEQKEGELFNRGRLANVGIKLTNEYKGRKSFDCLAVHDVDHLPFAGVDYTNCDTAYHMSYSLQSLKWASYYPEYFGGVTLMKTSDWVKINGFENEYWGWGAEDDDLLFRAKKHGVVDPSAIATKHRQAVSRMFTTHLEGVDERAPWRKANSMRWDKVRNGAIDTTKSGLNTLKYELIFDQREDFEMLTFGRIAGLAVRHVKVSFPGGPAK